MSVDHLYAPETPRAFQPADDRTRRWISEQKMFLHQEPAFVSYTIQRPELPEFKGLVGLYDLGERDLLPHESTTPSEVASRLADLERAGAMLEPILVVRYAEEPLTFKAGPQLRSVKYGEEVHVLHSVQPFQANSIDGGDEPSYVIADGHHRVEAIVEHARNTGTPPVALVILVDSKSPGLHVEPQHRVLSGPVPAPLAPCDNFDVQPFTLEDEVPSGAVAIVTENDAWLLLPRFEAGVSATVLEDFVAPLLGLAIAGVATRQEDVIHEVSLGASAAAIMGPIPFDIILSEALAGRVLPHKATCFAPKVAVGLVGALLTMHHSA